LQCDSDKNSTMQVHPCLGWETRRPLGWHDVSMLRCYLLSNPSDQWHPISKSDGRQRQRNHVVLLYSNMHKLASSKFTCSWTSSINNHARFQHAPNDRLSACSPAKEYLIPQNCSIVLPRWTLMTLNTRKILKLMTLTKTGPNDASGVVWTLHTFFFWFMFFLRILTHDFYYS
jgi:hypothetical protein